MHARLLMEGVVSRLSVRGGVFGSLGGGAWRMVRGYCGDTVGTRSVFARR